MTKTITFEEKNAWWHELVSVKIGDEIIYTVPAGKVAQVKIEVKEVTRCEG